MGKMGEKGKATSRATAAAASVFFEVDIGSEAEWEDAAPMRDATQAAKTADLAAEAVALARELEVHRAERRALGERVGRLDARSSALLRLSQIGR